MMWLRLPRFLAVAAVGLAALAACSNPSPPTGRWEGVYEDPALIVAVRLEIAPDGQVRVSAPNAVMNGSDLTASDRAQLRSRLRDGLARSWGSVEALPLNFDGKAFRKPGGVAPQLEWDARSRQMTMIYYQYGNRASVRVQLDPVAEFGRTS
jgi:hypothetical protein